MDRAENRPGLAIEVDRATKVIDGVTVLDGVTFTAHPDLVSEVMDAPLVWNGA